MARKMTAIEIIKAVLHMVALIAVIVFLVSASVPFWKDRPVKIQATVNGLGNAQIESGGPLP